MFFQSARPSPHRLIQPVSALLSSALVAVCSFPLRLCIGHAVCRIRTKDSISDNFLVANRHASCHIRYHSSGYGKWPNTSSFPRQPRPSASRTCSACRMQRRKRLSARSAGPTPMAQPVCPKCGGLDAYECRRPNGALRFRCKAAARRFQHHVGTLFASHKLPLRDYLAAIAIFCNEVKGKSALALSPRSGPVIQDAHSSCRTNARGHGRGIERPHDWRRRQGGRSRWRVFRRLRQACQPAREPHRPPPVENQTGKRKVVVVIREHGGETLPAVFRSEGAALRLDQVPRAKGTVVNADEAGSWNDLHDRFEMKRINHQEAYSARRRLHELGGGIISAACVVARSAITIISPARICSGTLKRRHGAKITAACPMASKCTASWVWRCIAAESWISAAIGSGISNTLDAETGEWNCF